MIGALQKINTNDHIGGLMEATIVQTVVHTANICHWLCRPECVWQLKSLVDKCFPPVNATGQEDELWPMRGPQCSYAWWDGGNFSPSSMHVGNSTIIYRPSPSEKPIGGQIQLIQNVQTKCGQMVKIHVRPYLPLPKALYDPFLQYPHFLATTYLSMLREAVDVIDLEDIVAHAACFDYSHNRTMLDNLSRD
ncbi:hypothetical protein F5050DRAFT_1581854 [Lentinula boryana]|uniref:Uncharacterized protein n=1 Tax=Lentinula boryana TaxID=40481 RepID=A0ABQ8PXN7_9AGAR|nr:hypothetical protein F5050DRAFT_1581854 [Lentinula boryana]